MTHSFSRRRFLKNAALFTAGATMSGMICPRKSSLPPQHIGVQLWSVREDMKKDPAATLRALSQMGYREVEPYGFDAGKLFEMSFSDFHKLLQDNNLTMPSTHAMVKLSNYVEKNRDIDDATKKWVDAAAGLGLKYLICPSMDQNDRPAITRLIELYAAMGRYCKSAGVRFAYHNHDFEFTPSLPDKNRLIIDWLLEMVPSELMAMQMDIYWVHYAKHNALDWIKKHPGRWELCHAKDLANTPKRETIEVGDGVIDFKAIFQRRREAGFQHFVVELEDYKTTPLEGVQRARKGLIEVFG